ncbi:lipopolysaccharide biosynthesis protein [Bacteroides difficilis]|uniref:lipopolysaccharide biosynthesis protein n=1 Tax=Bacteroides difficilis TaxID=2763021 RepID=UPI003AB038F7
MSQESRVKKSLLNARVNLIFYFLTLALSFFSRKIFLDTLGADFVGLTGTLQNLLGFLNLAELGIGSAIGYVLYKPLFDHDETKINEIISVFGYLYRWIGKIILIAGCILACFLPLIFPNTEFELGLIFFAYFSFLASSLIGYFANYKQTLLGADQKNYVVTAYFQTATIVKTIIQMALAYYTGNYDLWVIVELSFGIIYSFILNWKINQVYPWLKSEVSQGRILFKKYPEVMKYTKQLFLHKIGMFAQWQTIPFFIYTFSNLQMVAFYGNYTIITDKLNLLVNNLTESTSASVGNLIAEGNREKIIDTYWRLFYIRLYIAAVIVYGIFTFMEPFISLWIGKEYLLPKSILIVLCVNIFINQTNGTTAQFLFGYGMFKDTWVPICQFAACVIFSSILGYYYGLLGVLLGNTISLFLFIYVWKPFFLFIYGFKCNIFDYVFNLVKGGVLLIIPIIGVSHFLCLLSFHAIINTIIGIVVYSIVTLILMLCFCRSMRTFFTRIIKVFF